VLFLIRVTQTDDPAKDYIEKDDDRSLFLMMLSENDLLFHQPDTNLDSFAHLLKSLARDKFESIDGILNVHRQGRVVQITPYDPIFKDHEALMVYARQYYFEALEDFKWRPTNVLNWQACATPVSDL
jgi:hypothetical protein